MKNKYIIVSAFSPNDSEIASLRIEKISKFLSINNEVTVITGKPRISKNKTFNFNTIEIDYKTFKSNHSLKTFDIESNKKINKFNIYHFLEYFFPISPGGMRLYNFKKFESIIENEILKSFDKNIILFTSYGPFFITKLGYKLKKKYKNIIWINDFRDVFRNFDFKNDIKFMHKKMKRYILNSQFITAVSDIMLNNIKEKYNLETIRTFPLYNGFDKDDFINGDFNKKNNFIKFVFTGSFYPNDYREIDPFLIGLKKFKYNKEIRFIYCGKDSIYVKAKFKEYDLENILIDKGLVSRDESIKIQNSADVLLLLTYTGEKQSEGAWRISGKAYEYMCSNAIILNIGTNSWELKEILESDNVSKVIEASSSDQICDFIDIIYNNNYLNFDVKLRHQKLEYYNYKNIINRFESYTNFFE